MSFDPIELWQQMGLLTRGVVLILLVMSVYSAWVSIDRLLALRGARAGSLRFVLALREKLAKKDLPAARALSKEHAAGPLARIVGEALSEWEAGEQALAAAAPGELAGYDRLDGVQLALERVKERELAGLKKGLGGLASISSAAPFIGLFGTVVGIINAFRSMAQSGQGGLGSVSAGIAEALATTALGLAVAIPAVMLFNYFTGLVEAYSVDVNDVTGELVAMLHRSGKSRQA